MATFAELFRRLDTTSAQAAKRARRQTRLKFDFESQGGAVLGGYLAERKAYRTESLLKGLGQGRLKPEDLGPRDIELIGPQRVAKIREAQEQAIEQANDPGLGGFLESVLPAPVENLLGEKGLIGFAKGLPAGLFELGKNITEDVVSVVPGVDLGTPGSDVFKEVVQPIGEHYKEKYSGSFGDILEKALVEDPFGTLLDVATVATGGAGVVGGTARAGIRAGARRATRRGPEAVHIPSRTATRLASIGERRGRAAIPLEGGGTGAQRLYSPGILTREFQKKVLDPATAPGGILHGAKIVPTWAGTYGGRITVGEAMARRAERKLSRIEVGKAQIQSSVAARAHSRAFRRLEKKLSEAEILAWNLLKRGANLQRVAGGRTMLDLYQGTVKKVLDGETVNGVNLQWFENQGVPRELMEQMANLSPEVKNFIRAPSENMHLLDEAWEAEAKRTRELEGIPEAVHQERIYQTQQTLREVNGLHAYKDPAREFKRFENAQEGKVISPDYVPDLVAKGRYIDETFAPERYVKQGRLRRRVKYRKTPTPEQLLTAPAREYMRESDMRLLVGGAFRTDLNALREHITKREQALAHQDSIRAISERLAIKDKDTGEQLLAATEKEFDEALNRAGIPLHDRDNYAVWPENGIMQWFNQEISFEKFKEGVQRSLRDEDVPQEAFNRIDEIQDNFNAAMADKADMAHLSVLGATRAKNPIVHKNAYNHIQELLDPAPKTALGRAHNAALSKWRTAVLLYMPRWWITTLVGSAILAGLHGSLRYKYLTAARRVVRDPDLFHKWMRELPETRPGIRAIEQEGYRAGKRSARLFEVAEAIESRFKIAGAIRSMDKESRRIIEGEMMPSLRLFTRGDTPNMNQVIEKLLDNKRLTTIAMDESHRFFYNYSSLGPWERRVLRQFVPFWGFYKFATKLAWRLPFEYPSRTNLLDKLGEVAWEQYREEGLTGETGILPPWIEGSILLNRDNGVLRYLSTFGISPVADFATPFGEEGPVAGVVRTSQLSPVVQAVIHAIGIDPFTGKGVQFDPASEYGFDFLGRVVNAESGQEVLGGPLGAEGLERGLGTLLRSIPQVGFVEDLQLGGKHPYSSSIPLFAPRGVTGPSERPLDFSDFGRTFFGIGGDILQGGREYDLGSYQDLLSESVKAVRAAQKNAREREARRLRRGGP